MSLDWDAPDGSGNGTKSPKHPCPHISDGVIRRASALLWISICPLIVEACMHQNRYITPTSNRKHKHAKSQKSSRRRTCLPHLYRLRIVLQPPPRPCTCVVNPPLLLLYFMISLAFPPCMGAVWGLTFGPIVFVVIGF